MPPSALGSIASVRIADVATSAGCLKTQSTYRSSFSSLMAPVSALWAVAAVNWAIMVSAVRLVTGVVAASTRWIARLIFSLDGPSAPIAVVIEYAALSSGNLHSRVVFSVTPSDDCSDVVNS